MPVNLAALNINCANPNGNVSVAVSPGNEIITLHDNGVGFDQEPGDGIYSGQWTPSSGGSYALTFPNGDVLTVHALKNYRVQTTAPNYRIITGTSLNLGDNTTASISAPFPVLFGGSSFNQLIVSSNGTLSFTTHFSSRENNPLPTTGINPFAISTAGIDALVAPFWDDLYPVSGTDQNVFWAVTGTTPSRELVVEWRDVRHGSCNTDTSSAKFQVVFFEGSSNILFNYLDTTFGSNCRSANGGGSATVGVQIAQDVGTQFSYNNASLSKSKAILWTLNNDPDFPPPALTTPVNGATGISTTPNFTWSAVSGASSYHIMIATDQTVLPRGPWVGKCSGCLVNTTTTGTSYTHTSALSRGITYYWQVKAEGNSGQPGAWSEQWSFTTDPTLPPPTLTAPAANATGVGTKPTFSWYGVVMGTSGFRIMVATSEAALPSEPSATTCPACVINTTVPGGTFTPATAFSINTVYFWQVRSEGSFGGYWSNKSSFTTENIFPAPMLSSPTNGAIGILTKPTLRWQGVSGASMYRIMVATAQSALPTDPASARCTKCLINTTSTATSFTPSTALNSGAVYFWQVRAEGGSAKGGYWSQQRSFTTIPAGSGVVSITSVTPGAVINDFSVLVRGFVNVPFGTEVGVTVNGFPALVDQGQFALIVPLDDTVTGLTAVARDAMGTTLGSQTIPVTVQIPTEEPILLFRPLPFMGMAPLSVSFELRSLEPIARIDLDADGNGTVDFQGTKLDNQQFVYSGPGLYFPKVTVTDTANRIYTKTAVLLVVAQNELEALLQAKWTGLKDALRNGDIPTALKYIAISKRSDYSQVFSSLYIPLAQIDQVLTNITFIVMNRATAEYEMGRTDPQGEVAYLVRFNIDEDGIWRIRDF